MWTPLTPEPCGAQVCTVFEEDSALTHIGSMSAANTPQCPFTEAERCGQAPITPAVAEPPAMPDTSERVEKSRERSAELAAQEASHVPAVPQPAKRRK